MTSRYPISLLIALATCLPLVAQREPVLKQIDLPHPYYYREMYLPQLTTGPSSVAWLPDSRTLVYSMAGSLWKQKLDSFEAEQLTAGPGYSRGAGARTPVPPLFHAGCVSSWSSAFFRSTPQR